MQVLHYQTYTIAYCTIIICIIYTQIHAFECQGQKITTQFLSGGWNWGFLFPLCFLWGKKAIYQTIVLFTHSTLHLLLMYTYLPYVKNNHDSQQYYCNKQYVCKNIQQLIWKSKTHFNVKLTWWMSLDLTVSIPFWIDTTTITVVTFSITVEGELKTLPLNHSYPDSDSLIGGGT